MQSTNNVANKIIDIRQDGGGLTPLVPQIRSGLNARDGEEKKLPTLLLYSEEGLKLFEKITYLDEYYPTGQEIEVLEAYADRIADRIALESNSMLVELGSGYVHLVMSLPIPVIDTLAATFAKSESYSMPSTAKARMFPTMPWMCRK